MASQSIGVRIGVEGGPEYIRELRKITQETKTWKAEFDAISKSSQDPFLKAENSIESLNRALQNQEKRLEFATDQLNKHAEKYGENAAETSRWREEVFKAAGEIERLKKQIESFSTQKISVQGVGELKRDLETLSQAVSTFDSEFRLLSSQDGLSGVFGRASGMKDALTNQIATQQEVVKLLEEDYQKAVKAQGEFSEDALKMKEKVADATTELNRMSQELRDLPNGYELAGDELLKTGKKYSDVGTEFKQAAKPFWAATGVVTAGVAGIIKESQEFEKQMSVVQAVTGASTDELQLMAKAARDTALTSVYSATEVAEGMEILGRAGLGTGEVIESISAVLTLAAADGMEMADAASVLVDSLSVFGKSKDLQNSIHYADVFAQTSRSANTNVSLLAESAKYAAPSFAALGWEIEDAAFAMGLAADYGVKGSQAGTGLRQALKNLEAPTDKIAVLMEKYGISLDDGTGKAITFEQFMRQLRTSFNGLEVDIFDTNGELKDGEALMEEYGNSMPVPQLEKLQALSDIFGTRALPTMLALVNTGTADFNELAAAVYNADGAAQEMADTMIDNLAGQWTLFIDSVKELALEFGEVLLPVAKDVVAVARDIVDGLHGMDEGTRELIIKGGIILGLVGPLLSGIGSIFTGIGSIISVGGHLSKGIGGVIKLIGGASGTGGLIGLVGSGGGGLIKAFGGLIGSLGKVAIAFAPFLLKGAVVVGVAAGIGALIHHVQTSDSAFAQWARNAWQWGADFCSNFINSVRENGGGIKGVMTTVAEGIKKIFGHSTPEEGPLKDDDMWMTHMMQNFQKGIADNEGLVTGAITNVANGIWGNLGNLVSSAKGWGENFMSWLAGGFWSGIRWVSEAVSSLVDKVTSPIKNIISSAWSWGRDMMDNIKSGINWAKDGVVNAAKTVAGGIKSLLGFSEPETGPLSDFHTYMPDMMKLMAKGIVDNIPVVQEALGKTAYALLPSSWVDLPSSTGSRTTTNNLGGVTIVINAQPGQDADELAQIVEQRLIATYEREVYAYG